MMLVLAQTTVPVRIVNDSGPSWTEIAGVAATFAAVVVALFAIPLRARLKRPKLGLAPGTEALGNAVGLDPVLMTLRLYNAKGRDTARDVEVFVTVISEGAPPVHLVAEEANLNFDDPLPRVANPRGSVSVSTTEPGRSTATVPSGFARSVSFAVVGQEAGDVTNAWGYLALYPTRMAKDASLLSVLGYKASIVVTGSNFDALTYEGELRFTEEDEPDDRGGHVRTRTLHWTKPPMRADPPVPSVGFRWR